jgi:hypothetical protein
LLVELYEDEHGYFATNNSAADDLLSAGLAGKPDDLPKAELAAWTSVARSLLNLNESITRN